MFRHRYEKGTATAVQHHKLIRLNTACCTRSLYGTVTGEVTKRTLLPLQLIHVSPSPDLLYYLREEQRGCISLETTYCVYLKH